MIYLNLSIVGKNIKQARKAKKLTQQQLAEIIQRTESSIRKYEKGLIQIPNDVIEQIASALEVSPFELLGADEWEEAFNPNGKLSKEAKLIKQIQQSYGEDAVQLLRWFNELNEQGKTKAVNDIVDMTEVSKYKKPPTEQQ